MNLLFNLLLFLFTKSIFLQSFSYTTNLATVSPQLGITRIINSLLFYPVNGIFNTSQESTVPWPVDNCTENSLAINLENQIWCIGYNPSIQQYSINLLDNITLNVISSYPALLNDYPATNLVVSGEYLIFVNESKINYNGTIFVQYLALNPFSTLSNQILCNDFVINVNLTSPTFPIFFNGEAFIYVLPNSSGYSELIYQTCSGYTQISKIDTIYEDLQLLALNKTSVYLSVYSKNGSSDIIYARSFSLNSKGEASFGDEIEVEGVTQINDTNFISPIFSGKNHTDFILCYIDKDLKINIVKTYKTGIPGYHSTLNLIQGTMNAIFTYSQGGQFILDLENENFLAVSGMLPPITISGGTIVNLTEVGIFYQTTTESHPHLLPLYWNGMYQDPTNPNHIFIMNIPNARNSLSSDCILLEINPSLEEISQTTYKHCPLLANITYTIKDITLDQNGNPVVGYRDSLNNLYFVSPNKNYGPYLVTTSLLFPAISINYANNIVMFMGVQLVPPNFVIGSFEYSTGSILSRGFTNNAATLNYLYKLSDQFVLLSATNSTSTTFTVWNIQDNSLVYNFSSGVPMQVSTTTPFFALNVNPIVNPSTIFSGIVVLASSGFPYLVNPDGYYSEISIPFEMNRIQVYPTGVESIVLLSNFDYLRLGQQILVTSWDSSDISEL